MSSLNSDETQAVQDAHVSGQIGMQRAYDKALSIDPAWGAKALDAFLTLARQEPGEFATFQIRAKAALLGVESPASNQSWGQITKAAIKLGKIRRVGVTPSPFSHGLSVPTYVWVGDGSA